MSDYMPLSRSFLDGIKTDDQFILAFPRSGSRYMMFLLKELVSQARSMETIVQEQSGGSELNFCVSEAVPNAHQIPLAHSFLPSLGLPRIFRSHHLREILERSNHRMVYVFRQAPAVMLSYYHYSLEEGLIAGDTTLDDFCVWHVPDWITHIRDALCFHRGETGGRMLFLRYLDDGCLNSRQLNACVRFFQLPFSQSGVELAVTKLNAAINTLNQGPNANIVRGDNRQCAEHFQPETLVMLKEKTDTLFQEAAEVADLQLEQLSPPRS